MPSDQDRTSPIPRSRSDDPDSQFGKSVDQSISGSVPPDSLPRHLVTARLASPVPSSIDGHDTPARYNSTPRQLPADRQQNFAISEIAPASLETHKSALTSALHPNSSDEHVDLGIETDGAQPIEDPEIVRRHLVQVPQQQADVTTPDSTGSGKIVAGPSDTANGDAAEEFSSLQLQGGDVTRPIYRWAEAETQGQNGSRRRKSFDLARPEPETETLDINTIKVPGGFRRDFIRRTGGDPEQNGLLEPADPEQGAVQPRLPTSSFLEFLTLYGHFAGEELEEDDEVLGPGEYFSRRTTGWGVEAEPSEETALLPPGTPGKHPRIPKERAAKATNDSTGAVMLLLKSFVGTGVLFLPKAFLNGGMLFSSVVLVAISALSYYCFILLVNTRNKVHGSFGDIGGALYGKHMRNIILSSIALSQFGFVSAYMVFVCENLQAFVLSVTDCDTFMPIKYIILLQLIIFLPLSLIRDIAKLAFTALVADVFILMGLVYLYGYGIKSIAENGVAEIQAFNPAAYTLLIGTAIFSFEGIGLVIPIQESMKRPEKFPRVLALVMVVITAIFLSMGVVGYATFGPDTKTVVILNLPQQDNFVRAIQFLYACAILLSTPLQLFPAVRILENGLFTRSGKYNPGIKWKKNLFRFLLVGFCALLAWAGAGDLDKFVSLVGSFACVPLVYVYPPILHYKAVANTRLQKFADIALAVFGVIGCIYTTTLTVQNWASGGSPPGLPDYCDV
ncbi:neutral amino acid transporter [Myotisia sp. PD_48]|nr:neutral amino acid transporter [Myotisia sp. PD_48]